MKINKFKKPEKLPRRVILLDTVSINDGMLAIVIMDESLYSCPRKITLLGIFYLKFSNVCELQRASIKWSLRIQNWTIHHT